MMWGRRTGVNKSSSCAYLTSPGMQCTHSSKVKTTFPWPYRGVQLPIKPLGPQLWWVPTEMTVNPHHKWAVRATWQGKILLPPKSQSPWGGSMLWGLEGLKPEMGQGKFGGTHSREQLRSRWAAWWIFLSLNSQDVTPFETRIQSKNFLDFWISGTGQLLQHH